MLTSFAANLAVVLSSLWNYVRTSLSSLSLVAVLLPCNAVSKRSSALRAPTVRLLWSIDRAHQKPHQIFNYDQSCYYGRTGASFMRERLLPLGVRASARVCQRETETRLIIIKVVWLGEIHLALSRPYPTHTEPAASSWFDDIAPKFARGSRSMNLNLLQRHLLSVLVVLE